MGMEGLLGPASLALPQTGKAGFKKSILKLVKDDIELYKIITQNREEKRWLGPLGTAPSAWSGERKPPLPAQATFRGT